MGYLILVLIVIGILIIVFKQPDSNKAESDMGISPTNVPEGYELKKKKKGNGCLFYIALFAITGMICIWIADNNKPPEGAVYKKTYGSDASDKFEAYNYAEYFVKKRLVSPSSAKFPSIMEKDKHIEYTGDQSYTIDSWVDSQNSFGAMIRQRFSCIVFFKDGNVYCEYLILKPW